MYLRHRESMKKTHELLRAEQVIRPTGLLDPEVEVRPIEGQIDDLISEVNKETAKKNKVLITTLTKAYGGRSDRLYAGAWHPCEISTFGY